MHDLDVHAAFLRDRNRLRQRVEHMIGFIAQVRKVAAVVAREHAGKRNHLRWLRIGAGRREQAGGKPERPRLERFLE